MRHLKLLSLFAGIMVSITAFAQLDAKEKVEGVGVDEKLGDMIDLKTTFTAANGDTINLSKLFQDEKPVVLAPVYYDCPSMCTLTLNGVAELIDAMSLELGDDYKVVSFSIDPENTPELAAAKAKNYFGLLADGQKAPGNWHFLSGDPHAIQTLTDQIGFRYKKIEEEYSHVSIIALLSPKGKITRYFYGVNFPQREVALGLVEASSGKIGSTLDRVYTYCFRYDPLAGKYTLHARNVMRLGGILTLLCMIIVGSYLWRKDFFNKRRAIRDV